MPHRLKPLVQGALEPWTGLVSPDTSATAAFSIAGFGMATSSVVGTPWAMLWLFVGAMALDMGAGSLAAMLDPDDRFDREAMTIGLGKKLMGLLVVLAAHIMDRAFIAMGADPALFGLIPDWAGALVSHPLTVLTLLGLLISEIASVVKNARRVRSFGPIVTGLMDRVTGQEE